MLYCSICKKKIDEEKLDKMYQISNGYFIHNHFYEKDIYYYHLDCLNVKSKNITKSCLKIAL